MADETQEQAETQPRPSGAGFVQGLIGGKHQLALTFANQWLYALDPAGRCDYDSRREAEAQIQRLLDSRKNELTFAVDDVPRHIDASVLGTRLLILHFLLWTLALPVVMSAVFLLNRIAAGSSTVVIVMGGASVFLGSAFVGFFINQQLTRPFGRLLNRLVGSRFFMDENQAESP